ncbi:hypothetical protein E2C01_037441 [Portunus trituberculatus]|uniref:Uncharacterized protein n=1 Tax=Portunus trituberculatus TaxID=210409 RepID=A0A5B7FEY9_PORTR|nr:hypothetical protein [Portunus trituberculatus]
MREQRDLYSSITRFAGSYVFRNSTLNFHQITPIRLKRGNGRLQLMRWKQKQGGMCPSTQTEDELDSPSIAAAGPCRLEHLQTLPPSPNPSHVAAPTLHARERTQQLPGQRSDTETLT